MVTERWDTDLRVLEAIVEADSKTTNAPSNLNVLKIVNDAGIPMTNDELVKSLERLDGQYLEVNFNRGGGGLLSYWVVGIRTEARRATRQWPSDDPYEMLESILTTRIEDAPDESTKSHLRGFLDALRGLGRDLSIDLLHDLVRKLIGL